MDGVEIRTEVSLPWAPGWHQQHPRRDGVTGTPRDAREDVSVQELSDLVLALEQFMTTGAGGRIRQAAFIGREVDHDRPGPRQRLRVERFCVGRVYERFVFYYTGIRRIAKDLLGRWWAAIWRAKLRRCRCCTASRRWLWKWRTR